MTHRLLAVLLLTACATDSESPETTDSGTPEMTEPGFCDDAPPATWNSFGEGFVVQHCQSCHATTTADRQGAPEAVVFDTEEDTWAWADRILARAAGDDADMPPMGGVEADERYLVEVWLTCGA
jgi:uncharacterized membrane protein